MQYYAEASVTEAINGREREREREREIVYMLSRNERHFIGKGLELITSTRLACTTMSEAYRSSYHA